MHFNSHSDKEGQHAILGASNWHWVNYDDEKLKQKFRTHRMAQKGSELHDIAKALILNHINLPKTKHTFNMYVNDCIGFKMKPEQMLYISENAFGTADAISFRQNILRISDLKTGTHKANITQLYVYAAWFCMEYRIDPFKIKTELRIYQNNECILEIADPQIIKQIIDKTIYSDKKINNMMKGEE